jgi:G:T-mismatch repair DNA endonuclease (very short patch repair protein)
MRLNTYLFLISSMKVQLWNNPEERIENIRKSWSKKRRLYQSELTKKYWKEGKFQVKHGKDHPRWVEKTSVPCCFCKHKIHITSYKAKSKRFCSKKCYSKWQEVNMTGKNNIFYGKHHSKESIESNRFKHLFNMKPETREKIREARMKQKLPKEDTSIEVFLFNILRKLKVSFIPHKPLLGITRPDAFVSPNKCIYADGDYWHTNPKFYSFWNMTQLKNRERDIIANSTLKQNGYKVLRLWENDIEKHPERCINRIVKFLSM